MAQIEVTRTIAAPASVVFKAVADVEGLPATNADIVGIEFLSALRTGIGTRFKETRRMGKKEHVGALAAHCEAQRA